MPEAGFMHIQDSFGSRTGAADNCIKALRAAYHWGEKRGYPKESPVLTIDKVHEGKGGAVPWDVSEMQQLPSSRLTSIQDEFTLAASTQNLRK
jgi:hypothetical protein